MFTPAPQPDAPTDTAALIAHIQGRHHDRHRADLADLLPLARKVEDAHFGDPDLPVALEDMAADLAHHMHLENDILFPRFEAMAADAG